MAGTEGVREFKLPDVGEGLTEAEIVSWKVKPGDSVAVNDVVVEIETAKSLVELPIPYAGTVEQLLVEEGVMVPVGSPIIGIRTGGGTGGAAAAAPPVETAPPVDTPAEGEPVEPGLIGGPAPGGRTSVLVGYGPRSTQAKRRPRKASAGAEEERQGSRAAVQHTFDTPPSTPVSPPRPAHPVHPVPSVGVPGVERARVGQPVEPPSGGPAVLAKPPVRKLARDLGVDLKAVAPTGPGGTVTRADVQQVAAGGAGPATDQPATDQRATDQPDAAPAGVSSASPAAGWQQGEREQRVAVRSVRRATADAMVRSAFTAPHVTMFHEVDATATVELVTRLRGTREFRDVKLSPLAVVARAVCVAVRRTPEVNATWDAAAGEIVYKRYVNLGIAAATPRGLVVPNVKDADRLSLRELAQAVNTLAATAREGRTPPADMQGGTFSITNVGVFGVDTGTPILPPGEAGILALGAIRAKPWVVDGGVVPRQVTTLAMSFDHRLVDGEQGSRFLADVARLVEDPAYALVWG